ncbi:MAG TPA: hypothetical protein VHC50_06810 [Puia sp.]|nr:hypothetical protein [Puia sp.]
MENNPKNWYAPPASLLRGCYAYSHSIFWRADPPYNKKIPQLTAQYESPSDPGKFIPVQGYSVASFAGHICFDGAGKLRGGGIGNRGGVAIDAVPISITGTYTVDVDWSTGAPVYTGRIITESMGTVINHYYVMADSWKELKFIMLGSYNDSGPLRQPVTSGIMTRIHT